MKQTNKATGKFELAPNQIAGLIHWFDASDVATLTKTGNLVDGWADKSGNNRHAGSLSTARPDHGVNTINGLPVVSYASTENMSAAWDNTVGDLTATIILQTSQTTSYANWYGGTWYYGNDVGGVAADFAFWSSMGTMGFQSELASNQNGYSNRIWDGKPHVVTVVRDRVAGTADLYIDGKLDVTMSGIGTKVLSAISTVFIGTRFIGDIAEFYSHKAKLDAGQVAALHAASMKKWGISSAPKVVNKGSTTSKELFGSQGTFLKTTGNVEVGDLLVAVIYTGAAAPGLVAPSGWKYVYSYSPSSACMHILTKIATQADVDAAGFAFKWTISGGSDAIASFGAFGNVATYQVNTAFSTATTGTTLVPSSVRAFADNSLEVVFIGTAYGNKSFSVVAAFDEVFDLNLAGGSGAGITFARFDRRLGRYQGAGPTQETISWTSTGSRRVAMNLLMQPKPDNSPAENVPHRHWRINVLTTMGGTILDWSEVEFKRDGVDLTNPTTALTAASASSVYSVGLEAYNAFDNTSGTRWATVDPATFPQWIAYDFGTPVLLDEISITPASSAVRAPSRFELQYSDDGLTWETKVDINDGLGYTVNVPRTYYLS